MDDLLAYISQRALAGRWAVSERTLERWRAMEVGPAWHVFGRVVRYRLKDIEDFEEASRHVSSFGKNAGSEGGAQ